MENTDLNTSKINQLNNKPEYIAPQVKTYSVELIQATPGIGGDGGGCHS